MDTCRIPILAVLLFFCICNGSVDAKCSLSDLALTQTSPAPGKEYEVTVENRCICTQSHVVLACAGFNASSAHVEPANVVAPVDGGDGKLLCTLAGGDPVWNGRPVKFSYAAAARIDFSPVSSTISCS